MNRRQAIRWAATVFVGGYLLLSGMIVAAPTPTSGRLSWQTPNGPVSADIEAWPLTKVLRSIAAQTHWRIYVDPHAGCEITAKFNELPTGEALGKLLAQLNFALVPSTKGPTRLYVFNTTPQEATRLIVGPTDDVGAHHAKRIKNELLVVLSPSAKENIDELARQLGAKVVGRLDALHAYRLRFASAEAADQARAELQGQNGVGLVDSNYLVPRPNAGDFLGNSLLSTLSLQPQLGSAGNRVVIGLVDTPVQTQGTPLGNFVLPSVQVPGTPDPTTTTAAPASSDTLDHGTSMAETMLYTLATSPDANANTSVQVLPVDVFGNSQGTTTFQIAQGIYTAIEHGAPIINLSVGGNVDSPLLHDVIVAGHNQGVVFLAAAGNVPTAAPTYPAAYPEVLAVTALSSDGQLAPYANYGSFVDLATSGTSIVPFDGSPWLVVGTSPATARASAIAAAIASTTGQRGPALEAALRSALAVQPGLAPAP